ncbi:MAG: hypothetical protein HRU03_03565 [Nanoarchaeales archaeon]|nr:hypothetical protein [Nanoarchaeales archaeon]
MSIFSIKKESGEVQAYRILKNSISHILLEITTLTNQIHNSTKETLIRKFNNELTSFFQRLSSIENIFIGYKKDKLVKILDDFSLEHPIRASHIPIEGKTEDKISKLKEELINLKNLLKNNEIK